MESLMKIAIRVYDGMIAVYPQYGKECKIYISEWLPKFPGCYAVNNSTVAFIYENRFYVIPYTRKVIRTLKSNGFMEANFSVPFSSGSYPKAEREKWERLRDMALDSYHQDFVKDCINYCDKHGIGTISDETLKNCFRMPQRGVRVRRGDYEHCYYPVLNYYCFDYVCELKIGRYCCNNGRVVFVYRDGYTYVTKGYQIVKELETAGYTETGIFVPFSNGEEILDYALKARWEAIKK